MLTLLATLAQVALHAPVPCGILSLTVDSLAPGVYAAYQRQPFPSMLYLEGNSTIIINSRDVVVVEIGVRLGLHVIIEVLPETPVELAAYIVRRRCAAPPFSTNAPSGESEGDFGSPRGLYDQ